MDYPMADTEVKIIPLDSATQLDNTSADNVFVIGSQATTGPALWPPRLMSGQ